MKVVVDNNLPRSVSRLLAESGLEAVHVGELGLSQATDQMLRQRFAGESVIFVSRDEDFWSQHPPRWRS
jgi:predicted nuclease of predicted toxin-antitoxin system